MGLFDFFRRRRERESAVQLPSSAGADPATQPVVGQQVAGGGGYDLSSMNLDSPGALESLEMLTQLGPALQQAIAEGNVTIAQGPSQTIDMRGSPLGDEIREILKANGVDPEGQGQSGQSIDAAHFGDMQRQILAALAKHGVDPTGGATTFDGPTEKKND